VYSRRRPALELVQLRSLGGGTIRHCSDQYSVLFHYYSLDGNTARPVGLHARLCHAVLVITIIISPPPPGGGAKGCDEYVCLFVHLSVSLHNSKTDGQTINNNLLCMLPVAVAWSFSDSVAICYVLPVLWMTVFILWGQWARIKHVVYKKFAMWRYHSLMSDIVWLNSSECGTGGEVCYLRLFCYYCTSVLYFTFKTDKHKAVGSQASYSSLSPVSLGMGDRIRAGISPQYM